MTTKTVYLFDELTGEYRGTYEAHESPLEPGNYIAPVHSTEVAPPVLTTNQVAVFSGGIWTAVPDFRGQTWFDQTSGSPIKILLLGQPASNFAATLPAALQLAQAKAVQVAIIEAARDAARFANVTATVGGVSHQWQADSNSVDLLNGAISLAQAGLPLPSAWRSFDNANVPISAIADLLAIAGAIAAQTQSAYAKSWTLKAQIVSATTVAAVQAVIW
jgi:hypothetical protein